MTIGQI